jgi:DivIVA domain-containing protein
VLTALALLGVLGALFLAGALATREGAVLVPAPPDAPDLGLPDGPPGAVGADDVRGLRFGLAARGYRMSEVDAALARLADELEERDLRLAELGRPVQEQPVGELPVEELSVDELSVDEPRVGGPAVRGPVHDEVLDADRAGSVPLEVADPPRSA